MSTPKAARPRSTEEADFQRAVIDLAKILGLMVFHSGDSRRDLCAGWPDLFIVGTKAALAAELKAEQGRVRREQAEWLEALATVGIKTAIWRPHDLRSGRILADLRRLR